LSRIPRLHVRLAKPHPCLFMLVMS